MKTTIVAPILLLVLAGLMLILGRMTAPEPPQPERECVQVAASDGRGLPSCGTKV